MTIKYHHWQIIIKMKSKYKAVGTAILLLVITAVIGMGLFMSRIPDKRWLEIKTGMEFSKIEKIIGKPTHPSAKLKNMDRWIIDSLLFNSRLVVYYAKDSKSRIAAKVEIKRYCKFTGKYTVEIRQ